MGIGSVLLLLSVGVVTCYAQSKCCFPNQFVTGLGEEVGSVASGKPSLVAETADAAFDYTNKRIGVIANISQEGQVISAQVISDYKEGAQYVVLPKRQVCQKLPLSGPMQHCVPANATYVSSIYLGDHKLTVDIFHYSMMGAQVSLSVTKGDCLPGSVTIAGDVQGTPSLTLVGYFNYVSGIKNPSKYFTVPSYCPKSFSNEARMYDMRHFNIFP